jgi:hypothetical protein
VLVAVGVLLGVLLLSVRTLALGQEKLADSLAAAMARGGVLSATAFLQQNAYYVYAQVPPPPNANRGEALFAAVSAQPTISGSLSSWLVPLVPSDIAVITNPPFPSLACECVAVTVQVTRAAGKSGQFVRTASLTSTIQTPSVFPPQVPPPDPAPCPSACASALSGQNISEWEPSAGLDVVASPIGQLESLELLQPIELPVVGLPGHAKETP